MGSFTGARASIGQEELHWARFAVSQFNAQNGTDFKVVEGDFADDPAQSSTLAQQFVSNSSILGVAGPDASSAVVTVGGLFKESRDGVHLGLGNARLTHERRLPDVLPGRAERIQAPTDANFMIKRLHAKKVVLVDNQTDYSLALNDAVAKILKAAGVSVTGSRPPPPKRLLRFRRNDRL